MPESKSAAKTLSKKAAPDASKAADAVAKKPSAAKAAGSRKMKIAVTPEQRHQMITEAAYFRAEKRGFVGDNSAQDWIEAEAEIDDLLKTEAAIH